MILDVCLAGAARLMPSAMVPRSAVASGFVNVIVGDRSANGIRGAAGATVNLRIDIYYASNAGFV